MTSSVIKKMIDNFSDNISDQYESFTYTSSENTYNNSAIDHEVTFVMKNGEKYQMRHTVGNVGMCFNFAIYKFDTSSDKWNRI